MNNPAVSRWNQDLQRAWGYVKMPMIAVAVVALVMALLYRPPMNRNVGMKVPAANISAVATCEQHANFFASFHLSGGKLRLIEYGDTEIDQLPNNMVVGSYHHGVLSWKTTRSTLTFCELQESYVGTDEWDIGTWGQAGRYVVSQPHSQGVISIVGYDSSLKDLAKIGLILVVEPNGRLVARGTLQT